MEGILELFSAYPIFLALVVIALLAPFILRYWQKAQPFSVREKLKELGDHITKIEKENDTLAQTIDDLKKDMVKRMDSVDASLTQLTGNVGEVKKETINIEKHVDCIEEITDETTKKVDVIKHQVEVDLGELRRIDGQIKDSLNKVEQTAQQIKYLADEVHDLEHEVHGSSRKRRDYELRPE
jgi:chromosome segregation ATPase